MYTLTNIRFAPRPDIFSHLWQGFLSRLIAQDEHEVAKYMYKEVSCIMPGEALALPDEPWPIALEATGQYFFAPHWSGLWGVWAGTACGNQPTEATHSSWQLKLSCRRRTARGKRRTIGQAKRFCLRVRKSWSKGCSTGASWCGSTGRLRWTSTWQPARAVPSFLSVIMRTARSGPLAGTLRKSWWRRTPRQASTCWRRFRRR